MLLIMELLMQLDNFERVSMEFIETKYDMWMEKDYLKKLYTRQKVVKI